MMTKPRVVSFGVRYHRTPGDALVDVVVACERIMKVSTLTCNETPLSAWTRAFPGSGRQAILERAAAGAARHPRSGGVARWT